MPPLTRNPPQTIDVPDKIRSDILELIPKESSKDPVKHSKALAQGLRAIMPEIIPGDAYMSLGSTTPSSVMQFVKLAIYLLSNNFLRPGVEIGQRTLQWLQSKENTQLV